MSLLHAPPPAAGLGRLVQLGPKEPWQLAYLLPQRFEDLSCYPSVKAIPCDHDGKVCLSLTITSDTRCNPGRPPRVVADGIDADGQVVKLVMFGNIDEAKAVLTQGPAVVRGSVKRLDATILFNVSESISPHWQDRLRPVYAGKKGVIGPGLVRERVHSHLPRALARASVELVDRIEASGHEVESLFDQLGCAGWTPEQLLMQSHQPASEEYAKHAHDTLDRIAALIVVGTIKHAAAGLGNVRKSFSNRSISSRTAALPFPVTDEQQLAIQEVAGEIFDSKTLMRHLLIGDVGTGKTAVYAVIVAALVDGGGRALVLLPGEALAQQVFEEFSAFWPDLDSALVTATNSKRSVDSHSLIIGTTALLHRDVGHVDLVVVDEQQKFARHQREQLVGGSTHLLEVSATCIPRSMALLKYGVVTMSSLAEPHTPKVIHTRIWKRAERGILFDRVRQQIDAGDQVLIVYPVKAEKAADGTQSLGSVAGAELAWNKQFPGQVRVLTGSDDSTSKAASLADMRSGRASILVATTAVEVGLNIPKLRQVIVVEPQQFGLTTLHQIRGRVARAGGEGWCDLYAADELSEKASARLNALVETRDGYAVAQADLELRGFGDLSADSRQQSGKHETFLFGRSVSIEALDMLKVIGLI